MAKKHWSTFTLVPSDWAVRPPSVAMLQVWVVLWDHRGTDGLCWPSRSRITNLTNLTERTVTRAINALRDGGLIEVVQAGSGREVQRYRIKWNPADALEHYGRNASAPDVTPGVTAVSPLPGHPCHPRGDRDVAQKTEPEKTEPMKQPLSCGEGEGSPSAPVPPASKPKSKAAPVQLLVDRWNAACAETPNLKAIGAVGKDIRLAMRRWWTLAVKERPEDPWAFCDAYIEAVKLDMTTGWKPSTSAAWYFRSTAKCDFLADRGHVAMKILRGELEGEPRLRVVSPAAGPAPDLPPEKRHRSFDWMMEAARKSLRPAAFKTWFAPLRCHGERMDALLVSHPDDWLGTGAPEFFADNYLGFASEAARMPVDVVPRRDLTPPVQSAALGGQREATT